MTDKTNIRKPNKKARELGDDIVKLASWGMLSQVEIGAYMDRLRFWLSLFIATVILTMIILFQIPNAGDLRGQVSLIVGFAGITISLLGILNGIETLFLKERYERKVIIYPCSYKIENERVVATAINIGDPLVIRRLDLVVGWVEVHRPISNVLGRGVFTFVVSGYVPLSAGCMPMNKGSIWRISEDLVRKGLIHIDSWLTKEYSAHVKETKSEVYLVMTDRFVEYRTADKKGTVGEQRKPIRGLISLVSLGEYCDLLDKAQAGEDLTMFEMEMEFKGDLKGGEPVPGRMITYTPPIAATDEEYRVEQMRILDRITEKLDSIEKKLNEKSKKSESRRRPS